MAEQGVNINANGGGKNGASESTVKPGVSSSPAATSLERRYSEETKAAAKTINEIMTTFFGLVLRRLTPEVGNAFYTLKEIVTPEAMQYLIDSNPVAVEFNKALKIAVDKALRTPFITKDGLVSNWTTGYIVVAFDSDGHVLGFDGSKERVQFLKYQVPKALCEALLYQPLGLPILSDLTDPANRGRLVEQAGIKPEDIYLGAIPPVMIGDFRLEKVYFVGGGALPDSKYVEDVMKPIPHTKKDDLAGAVEVALADLVAHYMRNPNAEVVPLKEPRVLSEIREQVEGLIEAIRIRS